jgi:hypothetical protein
MQGLACKAMKETSFRLRFSIAAVRKSLLRREGLKAYTITQQDELALLLSWTFPP